MPNRSIRIVTGLALALTLVLAASTRSQAGGGDGPRPLFSFAGPAFQDEVLASFFVPLPPGPAMDRVAFEFEVHHRLPGGFEVIVPAQRVPELLAMVPDARMLEADINAELKALDSRALAGYHDFTSVEEHLRRISTDHADLARMDTYGRSKEGRSLFVLTVTGHGGTLAEKKEVLLTSSTHGDELISVEVLMGLLDKLVEGYGTDARLTKILDSRIIHFVPVVNPDGYTRKQRYSNGVDPNREYPWPSNPDRRPNECIQAIMDFVDARDIAGSIDYHASGGMFMYPWAYTSQHTQDHSKFADITRRMAATNGYQHGQIPALLYPAPGSSADYYYWKKRSISLGIEIGNSKIPSASQIPNHVKANAEALWIFLESV